MREGDVVIAPLPQADGRIKNRPVIVLRKFPPFGDFLACGISSQISQAVPGFDELIDSGDDDFVTSGLKVPSLIRLGFLALLASGDLVGRIGSISSTRHRRLLERLSEYLTR